MTDSSYIIETKKRKGKWSNTNMMKNKANCGAEIVGDNTRSRFVRNKNLKVKDRQGIKENKFVPATNR